MADVLDPQETEVVTATPKLSTDVAAKSLEEGKTVLKNPDAAQALDQKIAPTSNVVRSVANEGPAQASLVKKDVDKLSTIEKYTENFSIEMETAKIRDKIKDQVYEMTNLRSKGLDFNEDQKLQLENLELDMEELNQRRESMKLNMAESALTGDLPSVFRDFGAAASDSPANAVIGASGLLGFFAGPAVGAVALRVSTAAASAKYNWERTYATSYLDIDKMKDPNGNEIPHDLKNTIAQTSAYIQSTLEAGADLALLKTAKFLKLNKINSKIAKYALDNPGFKAWMVDFTKRAATQGFAESITEVLQDQTGDIAKALGQTWTKEEGLKTSKAIDQYKKDFSVDKTLETAGRAFIVGKSSVAIGDIGHSTFDKGRAIYKKYTGTDVKIGPDDTIIEEAPMTFNGKEAKTQKSSVKFNLPTVQTAPSTEVSTEVKEPEQPKAFTTVDGVPKYLSLEDAVMLGEMIPAINEVNNVDVSGTDLSREEIQLRLLEKNRVKQVFVDREKIEEWSTTEERKNEAAKAFLGDKGAYLDAQKVPIPSDLYVKLLSMGDVQMLTDATAITSDGPTVGDIKAELKNMGTKKTPTGEQIKDLDTSDEMTDDNPAAKGKGGVRDLQDEAKPGAKFKSKDGSIYTIREVIDEHGLPTIQAFDEDGKSIAELDAHTELAENGRPFHPNVFVDEAHRRKGVATALYDYAESKGYKITDLDEKGKFRTDEGEAFRQARGKGGNTVFEPNIDKAIEGYEDYGLVTKNIYDQMSDAEKANWDERVNKAKADQKESFKEKVLDEYEETVDLQTREADAIAEEEIVENIMKDDNIIIVDTFMAERSLRIDPSTLPAGMEKMVEDPVLEHRKVFKKKGGMHIDEVAGQMGVTPQQLLHALSTTPSSKQAYNMKIKLEKAKNRAEAIKNTNLNEEAIKKTIDDKIKLKLTTLTNMLRESPRNAMGLIYSVLKTGDKTSVDSVNINAQEITDNTRIGNVSPKSYLNASRRHANRANMQSHKKMDLVEAARELEKSIVADELYKAAVGTKAKANRILGQVLNLTRNKSLLEKLESTGHRQAFDALTAMLGKRKMTEKDANAIKNFLLTQQDNGLEADGNLPVALQTPVVQAQEDGKVVDVNDLSLAQIETIKAYIDSVLADSNHTINERKREQQLFGNVVAEKIRQDMTSNQNYDGSKANIYAKGGTGYIKQFLRTIFTSDITAKRYIENNKEMLDAFNVDKDAVLRLVMNMVEGIGQYDNGMGEKAKVELANRVKNFMNDKMGKATIKRLNDYASSAKRIKITEWQGAVGKNTLLASDGTVKVTDLISMLIIYGSEDGRNRLSKFEIDVKKLPETLSKYLHGDDIKIAEAVWEAHDMLKEGIIVTEKALKGRVDVGFIEGKRFMWNGREVKGGYVHFAYTSEQKLSTDTKWDMDALDQSLGEKNPVNSNKAAQGFTKEGFKKARAENLDAFLNLDLNTLVHGSIGAIIANNAMLVPIYNSMKILNNPENAKHITNVMGKTGYRIFKHNILATGRDTMFDVSQTWNELSGVLNTLSTIGNNFMLSKIVGSFSSVFNITISMANIGVSNLNQPTLLGNTALAYIKMLIRPHKVNPLIDALAEKIPAIRTDRSNFQIESHRSFKLYDKSEADNAIVRNAVNVTNTFTNFWLSKLMGGADELAKTGYSLALVDRYLNGKAKGGPTREQLNKMTEAERSRRMGAYVNDQLKKIFPDRAESSSSFLQRHPIGRLVTTFFSDARIALNYIVFKRIENIIDGFTQLPRNAAKNGYIKASVNSTTDVIGNFLLLQFNLSIIDSIMRSLRGEDEEGDKTTDQDFITRWLDIFKKDIVDPWLVVRGTAEMLPVISGLKFFIETDGQAGEYRTPFEQWLKAVFNTSRNFYNVGFNDGSFDEDSQKKDLVNVISGVTPLPTSIINNYIFGDSTAFQTGVKGLAMVPLLPIAVAKELLAKTIEDVKDLEVSTSMNTAEAQVLQETIAAQITTLIETPEGRSVIKNAYLADELEVIPLPQLYDIIFAESNGDPFAANPNSSAKGLGQFIVSTWNEQISGLGYDPAYPSEDMIPAGQIDGREDPQQAMEVLRIFHKNIAIKLVDAGIIPDQESIYMGHHFGPIPAIGILKAGEDEPVRDVYINSFDSRAKGIKEWNKTIRSNKWVKPAMTVKEFRDGLSHILDVGTGKRFDWEEKNEKDFDPLTSF